MCWSPFVFNRTKALPELGLAGRYGDVVPVPHQGYSDRIHSDGALPMIAQSCFFSSVPQPPIQALLRASTAGTRMVLSLGSQKASLPRIPLA